MSSEDIWVSSRSNQLVKDIALRARNDLHPRRSVPIDIIACLNNGSVLTVEGRKRLEYRVLDDPEMGLDDATTELIGDIVVVKVRKSVHQQALWGVGRARMTLAHELGHAVMHPGVAKARRMGAVGRAAADKPIPHNRSAEHQAKVFASAFLIDQELAENLPDANALSEEFSISLEAAEIAYKEIQLDRERRQSADLVLRLAAEFKNEVRGKVSEQPRFLTDSCPHCGEQKLAPIGIKYHCYGCGNTSDAFQDGDRLS
jgi:hypothetical protein